MKKLVIFRMYFWVVSAIFLVSIATSSDDHHLLENRVALFIFGDSLFDAGNNNYINTYRNFRSNYWPYGEIFGFPTGRATDGRIIPDFICEFANLPLIPPYLQPGFEDYSYGVNFASSAAGALRETYQGFVIDFKTQLIYFKNVQKQLRHKLGVKKADALLSNSVYLISMGGGDYVYRFEKDFSCFDSQSGLEELKDMVIGNLTDALQEINQRGGRKFVYANVPTVDCNPSMKGLAPPSLEDGCAKGLTKALQQHNKAVSQALQSLERKLKGFKCSLFDFYTSSFEMAENPSKYGFKDAEMACCGSGPYRGIHNCGSGTEKYELCENPSDFLYFDAHHICDKAYEQISKLFWTGNTTYTGPYNRESLFELHNKPKLELSSD